MKKLLFSFLVLGALQVHTYGQSSETPPATKGTLYGAEFTDEDEAVSPNDIDSKMTDGVFEGKVTGKVTEVCKTMGCWIRLEKADGSSLMVKTKDHGFFLPQTLVGKTVVMDGSASLKEVSEEKRRHFAEDAGKSAAEIKKIKGAVKEVQFIASGIKVLN